MNIGIIGGGISGLSIAQLLTKNHQVTVFEKSNKPGGLIKCERIEGHLFHRTGGHVFNSKRQDVLEWFWSFFNRDKEFIKTTRNAVVSMKDHQIVPYPIENHVYYFNKKIQESFIQDLFQINQNTGFVPKNFEEFLINQFGETLYKLYFKPYNNKIWRRDLTKIPLSWLEGKLPMPSVEDMIFNNMNHIEEKKFVHSSFYYAKKNGSQFIIDRLAQGLRIVCNAEIRTIQRRENKWEIEGDEFDKVIFCGNIKQLPSILTNEKSITSYKDSINGLEYHGTTTVLCEIEKNPYSWIYMPSPNHESHRIICTGNFSKTNNSKNKLSGTIEFTDEISKDKILENLKKISFSPKYITHHYEKYTYPIQNKDTKDMIQNLKTTLETKNFYLLGRFAEWEYYNMDTAIGAAMDLVYRIKTVN